MKKSLFILSSIYLHYIGEHILKKVSQQYEIILITSDGEPLPDTAHNHIKTVHIIKGDTDKSLRPVFKKSEIEKLVSEEINRKGSENVRIFCQQEDNLYLAATLREQYGLKGQKTDSARSFTDKVRMKEVVGRQLPDCIPAHMTLDKARFQQNPESYYPFLSDRLTSKMVIKPTSGNASLDVFVVESVDDLIHFKQHLDTSPYQFDYEIDEFIEGTMYQCDSLVKDGEIIFSEPLELSCTNLDFVKGQPLTVIPVTDSDLAEKMRTYNKEVISSLGFKDGATHHEFFYNPTSGKITFLEIAARIPGGMIVPFHHQNTGINMLESVLLMATDIEMDIDTSKGTKVDAFAALLPVGHGKIARLNQPDIESSYEIEWFVTEGSEVRSTSAGDRAGVLYARNDNPTQLRTDFCAMKHYQPTTCI